MKMNINPVYRKELRVSVRSFKFAMMVTAYNLLLSVVALFIFFVCFDSRFHTTLEYSDILTVYMSVACIEFGLIFFIVPVLTSSAIAGERERQTLEILLTTTLKPMQIVIGKLESSISMVLLLVISSIPVVSIVFSIGGISVGAVFGLLVLIIVSTILVGSIGIWCSAVLKKTIPSAVSTFGFMIIIMVGPVAVLLMLAYSLNIYYSVNMNQPVPDMGNAVLILLINPVFSAVSLFSRQFGNAGVLKMLFSSTFNCSVNSAITDNWFILSIIVQLIFSVFMLFTASKYLDPLRKRRVRRKEKKILKELQALEEAKRNMQPQGEMDDSQTGA